MSRDARHHNKERWAWGRQGEEGEVGYPTQIARQHVSPLISNLDTHHPQRCLHPQATHHPTPTPSPPPINHIFKQCCQLAPTPQTRIHTTHTQKRMHVPSSVTGPQHYSHCVVELCDSTSTQSQELSHLVHLAGSPRCVADDVVPHVEGVLEGPTAKPQSRQLANTPTCCT